MTLNAESINNLNCSTFSNDLKLIIAVFRLSIISNEYGLYFVSTTGNIFEDKSLKSDCFINSISFSKV